MYSMSESFPGVNYAVAREVIEQYKETPTICATGTYLRPQGGNGARAVGVARGRKVAPVRRDQIGKGHLARSPGVASKRRRVEDVRKLGAMAAVVDADRVVGTPWIEATIVAETLSVSATLARERTHDGRRTC